MRGRKREPTSPKETAWTPLGSYAPGERPLLPSETFFPFQGASVGRPSASGDLPTLHEPLFKMVPESKKAVNTAPQL